MMTKDDPHSPEAAIAMAATLLRNAGQPERPEDQAEITLLSLQPGDRPREGLVVVPEDELRLVASRLSTTIETAQSFGLQLAPIRTVKEQIDAMLTAAIEPEDSHE